MPQVSVKEILVRAAADSFREKGFHGTSIQDIASAAGVPKGSVYNHFDSKVSLAREVIERYATDTDVSNLEGEGSAVERITRHLRAQIERTKLTGIAFGCTLGNFSAESGDRELSEIQDDVSKAFDSWIGALAKTVKEAQANREIPTTQDPTSIAAALIDAFEGATLRSKVVNDTAPLETFMDVTVRLILS
jgi:TetR/AcrR family transcriptional repressor of nem operon